MGLFSKKKKEDKEDIVPSLPDLPKLPELPKVEERNDSIKPIHQLPSFPNNLIGEKFSQNTIKEAVAGKKEGEEVFDVNDFAEDRTRMMQKPLRNPLTKELPFSKKERKISEEFKETKKIVKKTEPIFIRIDKFEESLQVFENAKKQISEIEDMLKDIKRLKDEEEKELNYWENEMQIIKGQIEKIDRELFSKLE